MKQPADRREDGLRPAWSRFYRRFPAYVWVCLTVMLSTQMMVYYGTRILLPGRTLHVMTCALDDRIPFLPGWVTVYFAAFLSWAVSVIWILSESRPVAYRLTAAYPLALAVSAVVFLVYPGTMVRPEIVGSGFFADWMRFLYRVDSPTNLCPSLHVLISYFCWRGTFGCRRIPRWYKGFNLLFLILVCCSILFVKQHAVVDIPAALVIGEAALQTARIWRLERIGYAVERGLQRGKKGKGRA